MNTNTKACVSILVSSVVLAIMSCESPDYTFVGDPSRTGINVPAFSTATELTTLEGGTTELAAGDISFVLTWELTWDDDDYIWGGYSSWNWNSGYADMDIWVTEANGTTLSSSKEAGTVGLGPTASGGLIDIDDDGHEYYSGSTFGPERAYWPDGDAPVGEYRYGVRYFAGSAHVLYELKVYFGIELINEHKGQVVDPEADTSPEGPRINVGSVIYNGE